MAVASSWNMEHTMEEPSITPSFSSVTIVAVWQKDSTEGGVPAAPAGGAALADDDAGASG
jgi:hypothetical protein